MSEKTPGAFSRGHDLVSQFAGYEHPVKELLCLVAWDPYQRIEHERLEELSVIAVPYCLKRHLLDVRDMPYHILDG